jgi:threonine aldolase
MSGMILDRNDRALDFRSDNVAGVPLEILHALQEANRGSDSSYGEDAVSKRLKTTLEALFEHELAVFPVATGSAANALALAHLTPGWGSVLCHEGAHIATDECGAPEFFTGGAKLAGLPGADGKLSAAVVAAYLARDSRGVHHVQPAAISLTQSTEAGTCYSAAEIGAITSIARAHGLKTHMDGARFANAVAALGRTPAEITWKAGVDVLSFGLTKNGAISAEAIVFFDPAMAETFGYRRKRGGHLFSKMRFVSAQFEALLKGGLWLALAGTANAMAARLAAGLSALPDVSLVYPVQANEVFVAMPEARLAALERAGYRFYRWDAPVGGAIRLVTAFDTDVGAVDAFIETVASPDQGA